MLFTTNEDYNHKCIKLALKHSLQNQQKMIRRQCDGWACFCQQVLRSEVVFVIKHTVDRPLQQVDFFTWISATADVERQTSVNTMQGETLSEELGMLSWDGSWAGPVRVLPEKCILYLQGTLP